MANKTKKIDSRGSGKKDRNNNGPDCLLLMKNSMGVNSSTPMLMMIPIIIFSAFVIMIVRMHTYTRSMEQFFWTPQTNETQLTDFFSYDKMIVLVAMAYVALAFILLMLIYQSYAVKKTVLYIPMLVFVFFVVLSYVFSDYKEFALFGYNDRFEGTVPLICYMIMLFYIINCVNTERNVKQIIWPLAICSVMLSLLGLTQGLDIDFFRSEIGQKLITPNLTLSDGYSIWQAISDAFDQGETFFNFTFQNKEIYQTVYNINYVSFYLTLLVPLWAALFIRTIVAGAEEPLWKKIALGVLYALNFYNFIGSASSGGVIGIGIIGILTLVIFNKKLLKVWKPLAILLAETIIIAALTASRWSGELIGAFKGVLDSGNVDVEETSDEPGATHSWMNYMRTSEDKITIGLRDREQDDLTNEINICLEDSYILAKDGSGNAITCIQLEDGRLAFDDDRFYKYLTMITQVDENSGVMYVVLNAGGTELLFAYDGTQFLFVNDYGNAVALTEDVAHDWFFNQHLHLGSNRGYIWSRSLPMLLDHLFIGTGADTFCISFPQGDYTGRYNVNDDSWMSIIIDKPHNMYLNMGICTGCISMLAMIALYGIYVVQSIILFWKHEMGKDFLSYTGVGIFLGTTGFMFTGLVNDSTVSVMPMFYSLLGTGIAINMMLKSRKVEIQK